MPSFKHSFTPSGVSWLGSSVTLSTREIEDAGLREILQTPGPAIGHWGILDALLDSSCSDFRFLSPLGQAREVKVAISGLFGRFVARAYATRHLGLSHYAHIASPPMRLSGPMRGELRRVRGKRGDMPDWVAWGPGPGLAIVEAKGCHDRKGPGQTLSRAYTQAERGEIRIGSRLAPFKRYAIATRWGFALPTDWEPMLWVKDPDEAGDQLSPDELRELKAGVVRLNCASLLERLEHPELADALRRQASAPFPNRRTQADRDALAALERAVPRRVEGLPTVEPRDELIGGFITKGGLVAPDDLSAVDQETLSRLKMRPAFVGIERQMLKLAIEGAVEEIEHERVRSLLSASDAAAPGPRDDGAGSWVIRLDEDEASIG